MRHNCYSQGAQNWNSGVNFVISCHSLSWCSFLLSESLVLLGHTHQQTTCMFCRMKDLAKESSSKNIFTFCIWQVSVSNSSWFSTSNTWFMTSVLSLLLTNWVGSHIPSLDLSFIIYKMSPIIPYLPKRWNLSNIIFLRPSMLPQSEAEVIMSRWMLLIYQDFTVGLSLENIPVLHNVNYGTNYRSNMYV
jgi:hypothetical protein